MALLLSAILLASPVAQPPPRNLVRNSDFERAFLLGGPADGWRASTTAPRGGNAVRPGAGLEGGGAHAINVPQEAEVTWYICAQSLGALPPGGQFALSLWIRTEDVRNGAGAYAGVNYFGADGRRLSWTDTERKVTGTTDWVSVTQPFTVPPGTAEVALNLVLHGHGTAFFDRVQVEVGDTPTEWAPREAGPSTTPLPAGIAFTPSARGNVAILQSELPVTGTGSDPVYLRPLVEAAGYGCALLSADMLADPTVLTAARLDLVVLPHGASFPAQAADALLGFLRDGGSLLVFGGYPFDRLLARQNGAWKSVTDLVPDESRLTPLFDLAKGPAGWTTGGREVTPAASESGAGRNGQCLKLATAALSGWVTASSPVPERPVGDSRVTAFWARADQDDVTLAFEWDEKDHSRWRSRVTVGKEWRLYAVAHAELEYWHDNPSKGRGAPGDGFRPENAAHLAFGLTEEFLRKGQTYSVHIDGISVGDDPFPAWRRLQLNSRHGTPNPATFLETSPSAISICDPSAPLSEVATLAASPGQVVLREDWQVAASAQGWSATGQTGQGRAGAPLKARWQPVVDCRDRYGRLRGTAVAVMHNFAGEYAGSSWGYSAIDDRDLFAEGEATGEELFGALLGRLIRSAWLFDAQADPRCVRRGETATLAVAVANQASGERDLALTVTVSAEGRVIAEETRSLRLAAHRAEPAEVLWPVPEDAPGGLLVLEWTLNDGAKVLDRLGAGLVVWDDQLLAADPHLTYRNCYFERGRGPEFMLGSQVYWGNGTVTGTDPLNWDRQLSKMADSGLLIARSFMSMPWMRTLGGQDAWRGRDAMVQLAQAHGVSLFYSGVSWPTIDPTEVADRAKMATEAATRYRGSPGWFVDIVNEPSLSVGGGAQDDAEFRAWLKARYGTFEALREAWGEELTEASLDEVRLTPQKGDWASLRAVDVGRFMSHAMRRWTAETARAVRAGDPNRLVSVGHLQGFGSHEVMWDPIEASYDMDFANRHYYGDPLQYGPELMQIDMRTLGKAATSGEFGNTSHPGLTSHGVYAPEETVDWHYQYIAHTCFGLGGAFAASWHWQDPLEDVFPCGSLLADGAPRQRYHGYRNAGILLRRIRPRYEPPAVFFVVPTSHRFGNSKAAVEAAMNRSLAALISLHVDFGTVAEETLATLPPSAKALIWPVPFCPDDAAYQSVLAFVKAGGALYVSGDVSFDASRERTRTSRLTELCGVDFEAEQFSGVAYRPGMGIGVKAVETTPLASALAEYPLVGPCIVVRPTTARVLARSGLTPVATLASVGAGTVLYVVDPVELHTEPRAILAAFLQEVGVARHAIQPDLGTLHSHRVPGQNGALAQVLFNLADAPQSVTITDLPTELTLNLASTWGGAAFFAGEALVAVEARSADVAGRKLFEADASCCLLSLADEDLRSASGVLLLPSAAGELRLSGLSTEGRAASVGEVRGGRWVEYERLKLDGSPLRLDGPMARSLIIIGAEAELPELTERFVRELM